MCELLKQFFSKILRTISQTTFYVLFNPRLYFLQVFFGEKMSIQKEETWQQQKDKTYKTIFPQKRAESSANEPIWQTLITRYGTVKHTTRYDSCPQKRPQGGLLIIFGKLFFFTFQMVENYSSGEVETRLWLLVKESLFWFSPNIHW